MTTLVVGDLHGQHEIAMKAIKLANDNNWQLVFIGDYMDSFSRSIDDQVQTVRVVRDAIGTGLAIGLLGNHELSYMYPFMRCGGYNSVKQIYMNNFIADFNTMFKPYYWADGFLISHAGVSLELLELLEIDLATYLESVNHFQIGYSRGGNVTTGGLYWCDWEYEFVPIPGISQVVGHTRQKGGVIAEKEGNYCIDVLEDSDRKYGLLLDNGMATVQEIV